MRVALRDPDSDRLLESWRWLISDGKVSYVTLLGDLILERQGGFWFLESETARLEHIASSRSELLKKLEQEENLLLGSALVQELADKGLQLADGQCIGFKTPTVLGGTFDISNVYPADAYERVSFLGDMNEQLKEVPDGAQVRLVIGEKP
jgi:hypothetical protein